MLRFAVLKRNARVNQIGTLTNYRQPRRIASQLLMLLSGCLIASLAATESASILPLGVVAPAAQSAAPATVPKAPLADRDTVVVRAKRVWEDLQPDILHFDGGFDMRTEKWRILADKATLYGPINDPDRIEVNGSPAKIWLLERNESDDPIYGEGARAEYLNAAQLLRLMGDAVLIERDNRLTSSEIEYDLTTERFNAGGNQGVEITVESAGSALP